MKKDINVSATNMAELTNDAFMNCLFKKGEDTSGYVKVEGLTYAFGLHPQRLEENRELVKALLKQLPENFQEGGSFLELSFTKEGEQWTDMLHVCEQLIVMAIGMGLMEYCFPREWWFILPFGVPYLRIIK